MTELDEEWALFQNQLSNNTLSDNLVLQEEHIKTDIPKCSDIYISTQTKIAYLSSTIELYDIFWKLNVMDYYKQEEGIIKKSIKINCNTPEEVNVLDEKIKNSKNIEVNILSQVDNPNARKTKFKDIRKIDIGLCKKDLISYRKKKRGAFYNCFALILRIQYKNEYKEVHVKIFNTGKLEIPGIQYDELLTVTLNNLISILKPYTGEELEYNKENISTVLINSNFSCGFYIDRFKLYQILKNKYNINASYDPCSYPGIQCKFYYHNDKEINDGIKDSSLEGHWYEISFMIFRTGSVLIVGNCNSSILKVIYNYLKTILGEEYQNIFITNNTTKKKKSVKKVRKKKLLFTVE